MVSVPMYIGLVFWYSWRLEKKQTTKRLFLERLAQSKYVPDRSLAWLLELHVREHEILKHQEQLREFTHIALVRPSMSQAIQELPTQRRSAPAEHSGVHLVPTSSVIPLDSRTGSHRKHSQTAHRS